MARGVIVSNEDDEKETGNERPPEVEAPELVPVIEGYSKQEKPGR